MLPRGVAAAAAINAMVYMRAPPRAKAGPTPTPAWSRGARARAAGFKACERSDRGASAYRGGSGRLEVTRGATENALYDAFLAAGDRPARARRTT